MNCIYNDSNVVIASRSQGTMNLGGHNIYTNVNVISKVTISVTSKFRMFAISAASALNITGCTTSMNISSTTGSAAYLVGRIASAVLKVSSCKCVGNIKGTNDLAGLVATVSSSNSSI